MSKHKTKEEWIKLFTKYKLTGQIPKEYFDKLSLKDTSYAKRKRDRTLKVKIRDAKSRFKNKYKLWEIDDNYFMNKKETRGRKKKRSKKEIENVVNNLTNEELKDIAKRYIEITEKNKKKEASNFNWSNSRKSFVFNIHRTTFYKNKKERIYKFDFAKDVATKIFNDNKSRYGSKRLAIMMKKEGIIINDRTLRHYMNRWGLKCIVRNKRKQRESKNTNVEYQDLVKRNFNPKQDNIVATDVSYIPANTEQNFVYLSVAISHKNKLVESWKISLKNNIDLVKETLIPIKTRNNLIIHSDHGTQYSSDEIIKIHNNKKSKISMGRVGNSLDNREIEYFFSNIKSECLNHLPTYKMSFDEIIQVIDDYINWYNTKRIQKRLQWKTPTEVSAYAI